MSSTTRQDLTWADLRRRPDDRRPPAAVVIGAAMMLQLTWVGLGRADLSAVVLTAGVVVSAAVASLWLTLPAAMGEALFAFLVVDGFVQGSYGTLTWGGAEDLALLAGIVLLCVLVAEAAYEVRWSRPPRQDGHAPSDELVPWWYDDDLVELSLTMDLPDDEKDAAAPPADAAAHDTDDKNDSRMHTR